MVEDTPAEVREEPLKPLEQSTEVEEMPIRARGAVSKTDGRVVPEEYSPVALLTEMGSAAWMSCTVLDCRWSNASE